MNIFFGTVTLHYSGVPHYKGLKREVALWLSLAVGQNTSRQLASSSENVVTNARFLVALVTSELQF